eukprot:gnl/MRDRNA2_/MRDRNA2_95957_c0_seq1.p1 gnl/MRDRNA2_/MRDRNA2_95957_c0~~gnl/MRDRNA2_/MRDRNA2_95957_c0_seq1.p1  ORF type:complete len:115 (-),score=7.65 gnl/MRDRNA2_/MRDRNA2_95957_c0_seq1:290-634(-)
MFNSSSRQTGTVVGLPVLVTRGVRRRDDVSEIRPHLLKHSRWSKDNFKSQDEVTYEETCHPGWSRASRPRKRSRALLSFPSLTDAEEERHLEVLARRVKRANRMIRLPPLPEAA